MTSKSIVVALVAAGLVGTHIRAQTRPQKRPSSSAKKVPQKPADNGPSMTATAAWIEAEMPKIGTLYTNTSSSMSGISARAKSVISDVQVKSCRLSFTETWQIEIYGEIAQGPPTLSKNNVDIPLDVVDTAASRVERSFRFTNDVVAPENASQVRIVLAKVGGKTISLRGDLDASKTSRSVVDSSHAPRLFVAFRVSNPDDGRRLLTAIKHAAVLCGSKPSLF